MPQSVLKKEKGDMFNVISYGINKYKADKNSPSIHAEINAISNLPYIKKTKKKSNINILVIRTSHNGKINMSKPCLNCIRLMQILPQNKGYIIKNIYYSDENGNIIKTNLNKITNDKDIHISRFYRDHNYK